MTLTYATGILHGGKLKSRAMTDSSSSIPTPAANPDPAYQKLLGETARVSWGEIERLFGAGKVVRVAEGLDLVEVAQAFADDNAAALRTWMDASRVGLLDDAHALRWSSEPQISLWAVVVRPWVLVQERP